MVGYTAFDGIAEVLRSVGDGLESVRAALKANTVKAKILKDIKS